MIFDANYFYRFTDDEIRPVVTPYFAQYVNILKTVRRGIETELKITPLKWFTAGGNLQFFEARNRSDTTVKSSVEKRYYNSRIPNEPWFTYSLNMGISFNNLLLKGSVTQLYWYGNHKGAFYRFWAQDGLEDSKAEVPKQWRQDIGISFSFPQNRASISFEIHDLNNFVLQDNFGLQNPTRSFHLKLRCFLSSTQKG